MRIEQKDWQALKDMGWRWTVTLDGVPQRLVIWADAEKGELEVLVPDARGRAQIDPSDRSRALTEVRRGKVVLFIRSQIR